MSISRAKALNFATPTTGTQQKRTDPPLNVAVTANWRPIIGLTKDRNVHYWPES